MRPPSARYPGRTGLSVVGVRMRRVITPAVACLIATLLVAQPLPAVADPSLPAGATTAPPHQAAGDPANRPHHTTSAGTAAGSPRSAIPARTPVPGAVGAERRFPDPVVPQVRVPTQSASITIEPGPVLS